MEKSIDGLPDLLYSNPMTQTQTRTIEYLFMGLALMLLCTSLLHATPWQYTAGGLPVILFLYILFYGVEHSLRSVASWCMSWAVSLAYRSSVKQSWSEQLGRREASGLLRDDEIEPVETMQRKIAKVV